MINKILLVEALKSSLKNNKRFMKYATILAVDIYKDLKIVSTDAEQEAAIRYMASCMSLGSSLTRRKTLLEGALVGVIATLVVLQLKNYENRTSK